MIGTVKQWALRTIQWFARETKLHRWKVALTLVATVATVLGFYNMVDAKNADQLHRIECARAKGREDLRIVLIAFAKLPEEFGHSPAVLAYETSRELIVRTVLEPIHVENCPEP